VKTRALLPLLIVALFLFSCNQQAKRSEMKSVNNLKTTIEGEITANAKYLAYAPQARQDSMFEIAALFDAAGIAEKAHADRQITMLLTLGGSFSKFDPQYAAYNIKDNLLDAIEVENYEAENMYPGFIIISKEEGLEDVTVSFQWALQAEEKHRDFFKLALASLDDPSIELPTAYLVCPRCGNTIDAEHPVDPCDICENAASKFVEVK
jgi:rubrerythrin